jgi:hypothetical protein
MRKPIGVRRLTAVSVPAMRMLPQRAPQRNNSTISNPPYLNAVMLVKEAITEASATCQCDDLLYQKIADKHGVWRSTLTRQLNRVCASKEDQALEQRLMHRCDEEELARYTKGLTERHLVPTRRRIKNFVNPVIEREPSESWLTSFLNRNKDTLITAWTTPMDNDRHKPDSGEKYGQYRFC